MKLLTADNIRKLIANGTASKESMMDDGKSIDHKPVVKLFGGSSFTWLLTEIDPDDSNTAFGLCDLGQGSPELGYVSLSELQELKFKPFGLGVERDRYWIAEKTIGQYAKDAQQKGYISA